MKKLNELKSILEELENFDVTGLYEELEKNGIEYDEFGINVNMCRCISSFHEALNYICEGEE